MTKLDELIQAKEHIDALARGVNPFTGEPVSEGLLNDVRLVRSFFCASRELEALVEKQAKKQLKQGAMANISFEITDFPYEDRPIAIKHIAERINAIVGGGSRVVSSFRLRRSLTALGFLEPAMGRYGNAKFCPTKEGEEIGITVEKRQGLYGDYFAVFYNRKAQEFIVKNLPAVINAATMDKVSSSTDEDAED